MLPRASTQTLNLSFFEREAQTLSKPLRQQMRDSQQAGSGITSSRRNGRNNVKQASHSLL